MPKSRTLPRRLAVTLGGDVIALSSAAVLALVFHNIGRTTSSGAIRIVVESITIGIGSLALVRAYGDHLATERIRQAAALVRACVYGLAIQTIVDFAVGGPMSRTVLVVLWALAFPLVGLDRLLIAWLTRRSSSRERRARRAIVIGADASAVAMAKHLVTQGAPLSLVGFLDDYHRLGSHLLPGVPVLGRVRDFRRVCAEFEVGDVIVMPQALPWESLNTVISDSVNLDGFPRVHVGAGFYELLTTTVHYLSGVGVPLISVAKPRLTTVQSAVKFSLDSAIAIALLAAFSPLLGVCFLWQRLRGFRTFIARQPVLSRSSSAFDMLSLESTAPFNSTLLRKVPGLVNVIRGELAIVGPRPTPFGQAPRPASAASALRPGLTGPWRESDDPAEQVVLDLFYIRSYSVAHDMQVLGKRIAARLPHGQRVRRDRAKAVIKIEAAT